MKGVALLSAIALGIGTGAYFSAMFLGGPPVLGIVGGSILLAGAVSYLITGDTLFRG